MRFDIWDILESLLKPGNILLSPKTSKHENESKMFEPFYYKGILKMAKNGNLAWLWAFKKCIILPKKCIFFLKYVHAWRCADPM